MYKTHYTHLCEIERYIIEFSNRMQKFGLRDIFISFLYIILLIWGTVEFIKLDNFYFVLLFWLIFTILYILASDRIISPLIDYYKIFISYSRTLVLIKILHRYKRMYGYYPSLRNPQTFNEKIQLYKLHYRHPLMPLLADKCRVAEYLVEKGYENLLVKRYAVADSFDQLNFEDMPRSFVVKANHGWAMNFIVKDKFSYDFDIMKERLSKHMRYPYYDGIRYGEWHYLAIKPRIIVEQYLGREFGEREGVIDYKVHCFANKARYIQVGIDTVGSLKQTIYDRNWNNCYFNVHDVPVIQEHPKPKILSQMLAIAEELSSPFPYVRIDFYIVNNKLYFGEFTFSPAGGFDQFYPSHWDFVFGQQFPKF